MPRSLKHLHAQQIRWNILAVLHEGRKSGDVRKGGYLAFEVLRMHLDVLGHPLSETELHDYLAYLGDTEIACLERKKTGESAPYRYEYKITAKGVRAVTYEEKVPGVGIYSAEEED